MFGLLWRKTIALAGVYRYVCFQLVWLYSLCIQRRATHSPAHFQSHRCLSPLKNSDITYIFYLWILQSTSYHYLFTFKFIIQSLQDKIISLAWPQSPPFSLQWTFLWIKQVFTFYFLTFLSVLPGHLTSSPAIVWILGLQGTHMSNSMTSFQRSCSSTCLDHSTLLIGIKKDMNFRNAHNVAKWSWSNSISSNFWDIVVAFKYDYCENKIRVCTRFITVCKSNTH